MTVQVVMQYMMYIAFIIAVLAGITSAIVQGIKEMPKLSKIPTKAVAMVVSMIICILAMLIACTIFEMSIIWYYFIGAIVVAFFVYLVATGGWDNVKSIWDRVKYRGEITLDEGSKDDTGK